MKMTLTVTGPHNESGLLKGGGHEEGYGNYWHAVDEDGMILAWCMTPKGTDGLSKSGRRRLLARARYALQAEQRRIITGLR